MRTCIDVTIVTSTKTPGNAIEELMRIDSCLSARLRCQLAMEVRCLALGLDKEECGIFVNGHLIEGTTPPDLVDYLHLMLLSNYAA